MQALVSSVSERNTYDEGDSVVGNDFPILWMTVRWYMFESVRTSPSVSVRLRVCVRACVSLTTTKGLLS